VRGRSRGIRVTSLAEVVVDGGRVGEVQFPRSPAGEDGVQRRPSPDLGATDGGRGRGEGYRPYQRGAKARSGASA